MEDYRMDSQKLIYHPQRVIEWLEKGDCYPIYVEISPTNRCNHRCIFCALDYLGYKNIDLDIDIAKRLLRGLKQVNVKAIMFAGEGEPLLHNGIRELVSYANGAGLDISMTTNGSLLHETEDILLSELKWIRISLDAATSKTYSKIHQVKEEELIKVLDNIRSLVKLKKERRYNCTIGLQFLLLSINAPELEEVGGLAKDLGVDYLSIKPYSQHPSSINAPKAPSVTPRVVLDSLEGLNTDKFQVIYRESGFRKRGKERTYQQCLGLPFFCYIDSKGDVYTCSTFLGNEDFVYGNVYKHSFGYIWKGNKRKEVLERVYSMDISKCRENCRLDSINQYLWELRHPGTHVNFI